MSYEFRIGLLAAICIAVTVWGYKFMKGKNILNASNYYYVEYDNVDQLASTSPVLIHGLRVGTVSKVRLGKNMKSIIVTLDIDRDIRIPKETVAYIVSTSLMGGKAVVLRFDTGCSGNDCAEPGEYLKGATEGFFESIVAQDDIDKMKQGLGELLSVASDSLSSPESKSTFAKLFRDMQVITHNLAGITAQLNASMASYDNNVNATLTNLRKLTDALSGNSASISQTLLNLDSLTTSFVEADIAGQTSDVMQSADNAVRKLESTLENANQSFSDLKQILADIKAGKGTLGMLAENEELYVNLANTTRNLELLLQDLRLNPKRYINVSVFGKKQREYALPEEDPAFDENGN